MQPSFASQLMHRFASWKEICSGGSLAMLTHSRVRSSEIPIDPQFGERSSSGRTVETIHVHDLLRGGKSNFQRARKRATADQIRTVLATPLLRGGVSIGVIFYSPHRSPSFHRQADRSFENLCRPSCHCYRKRAVVQRNSRAQHGIARSLGTLNRHG